MSDKAVHQRQLNEDTRSFANALRGLRKTRTSSWWVRCGIWRPSNWP